MYYGLFEEDKKIMMTSKYDRLQGCILAVIVVCYMPVNTVIHEIFLYVLNMVCIAICIVMRGGGAVAFKNFWAVGKLSENFFVFQKFSSIKCKISG